MLTMVEKAWIGPFREVVSVLHTWGGGLRRMLWGGACQVMNRRHDSKPHDRQESLIHCLLLSIGSVCVRVCVCVCVCVCVLWMTHHFYHFLFFYFFFYHFLEHSGTNKWELPRVVAGFLWTLRTPLPLVLSLACLLCRESRRLRGKLAPKADKCSGLILILVLPHSAMGGERKKENSENHQSKMEFPDSLFPLCSSYHCLKQWFISLLICLNVSPSTRLWVMWEQEPHLCCSPFFPNKKSNIWHIVGIP